MHIQLLDTVVLNEDLPLHALKQGDVGAVVEVYAQDQFDVEFVTAAGSTQAVVMLNSDQVRTVGPEDILAVRPLHPA